MMTKNDVCAVMLVISGLISGRARACTQIADEIDHGLVFTTGQYDVASWVGWGTGWEFGEYRQPGARFADVLKTLADPSSSLVSRDTALTKIARLKERLTDLHKSTPGWTLPPDDQIACTYQQGALLMQKIASAACEAGGKAADQGLLVNPYKSSVGFFEAHPSIPSVPDFDANVPNDGDVTVLLLFSTNEATYEDFTACYMAERKSALATVNRFATVMLLLNSLQHPVPLLTTLGMEAWARSGVGIPGTNVSPSAITGIGQPSKSADPSGLHH